MKNKVLILIILIMISGLNLIGCRDGQKIKSNEVYRGLVVYPSDITSIGIENLIQFMRKAEINLLGIHTNSLGRNPMTGEFEDLPSLKVFLESEDGEKLLKECNKLKIYVEYESHVLKEVLPRKLFDVHPEYFRMDPDGIRQQNHNMCFSSEGAYKVIENNIIEIEIGRAHV